MDCSMPGFPVLTIFRTLLKLMFIEPDSLCYLTISSAAALFSFCKASILPSIMNPVLIYSR